MPTLPWQLDVIGAGAAWNITQGQGVVIAILDSGLTDGELPGLRLRELEPPPAPDPIGHGTSVTTLAAGSGDLGVWGVAPQARVLALSVLDGSGEISARAIVAGIYAAVQQGASVINMSFGEASDDPSIKAAIDYAAARGTVVVAAAGDTGSPAPLFPADLSDEVISVRALSKTGEPSPYGNGAGENGLDAPGLNMTAVKVENRVVVVGLTSGSSMATAVVSGSVALLESCAHRASGAHVSAATVVRTLHESARQGPWFNLRVALRTVGC